MEKSIRYTFGSLKEARKWRKEQVKLGRSVSQVYTNPNQVAECFVKNPEYDWKSEADSKIIAAKRMEKIRKEKKIDTPRCGYCHRILRGSRRTDWIWMAEIDPKENTVVCSRCDREGLGGGDGWESGR